MEDKRPINVNACNFEQVRAVLGDIEANQTALFEEAIKLRADFDAFIAQLGHLGARPT